MALHGARIREFICPFVAGSCMSVHLGDDGIDLLNS